MNDSAACLDEEEVVRLLSSEIDSRRTSEMEQHLTDCLTCRKKIEQHVGDENWWCDTESSLRSDSNADESHQNSTPLRRIPGESFGETGPHGVLDLLGPTDDPSMLGRIGPYEIIGLLGQGGMGAVFKGFDRSLNRFVAIKMLLPHLAASGAARKRFAREGRAVAAVVDDHVMAIHCVDQWQGIPYLVMTYSKGTSLQKRLQDNGPLELPEILRIGRQAAKGLAAAHSQGIVHRDIKPANIFLDENVERVQLMDFGLARAVDDATLTRSGALAGTPQYMSPEQVRSETVDQRSDLFSLGSVLYAMCTGHPPFRSETSYAVLRRITDDDARPIREINPDVPEWLEKIVAKLLSKSPGDRYDSAADVARTLEECLAHTQDPTTTPLPKSVAKLSPGRSHRPPWIKSIAAAVFTFSFILAGFMIILELNKGTLTIECDADNIPIRITQGDKVVARLTVSQVGTSTRITAGNYVVEVDQAFDDVTIEGGIVSLRKGENETVKISTQTLAPHQESSATAEAGSTPPIPMAPIEHQSEPKTPYGAEARVWKTFGLMGEPVDEIEFRGINRKLNTPKKKGFRLTKVRTPAAHEPGVRILRLGQMHAINPELQVGDILISIRSWQTGSAIDLDRIGRNLEIEDGEPQKFYFLRDNQLFFGHLQIAASEELKPNVTPTQRDFLSSIQGTWKMKSFFAGGRRSTKPRLYTDVQIAGSTLLLQRDDESFPYKMSDLDFSRSPIHVTFQRVTKADVLEFKGLISFDDGVLKFGMSNLPDATRPTSFAKAKDILVWDCVRPEPDDKILDANTLQPTANQRSTPFHWDMETGENVLWRSDLGSVTMRAPLVHDDHVYIGTNNAHGYLRRYPSDVDLGVLLCFRKSDGQFMWQHSNEKLTTGRVNDWPLQGVTSRPCVEANRLWYVSNRGEIVCLDTDGFRDGQNDGPVTDEAVIGDTEADVVWRLDMMKELGVRQHNLSTCTVAVWKDRLFAVTGNGVGASHLPPLADAPSFIAVDKTTGKLLWQDDSPGQNILHGQWGSPVVAKLAGRTQVIFPGGDGWLYSFDPEGTTDGTGKLIWKFDCNPKDAVWKLSQQSTRNNLLHAPTVHQGLLYVAMGRDPEHGSGPGRVWCIDPSGAGDVSPQLVFSKLDAEKPAPHQRVQACVTEDGDYTSPNPNSHAVWQFQQQDVNGNGVFEIEERMSRSLSTIAIRNELLFVSDIDGILHCLDRRTGSQHWAYDMLANTYSTPMVFGDHVYIGNEDGELLIFGCSADPNTAMPDGKPLQLIDCDASLNSTFIADNGVLYFTTKNELVAVERQP